MLVEALPAVSSSLPSFQNPPPPSGPALTRWWWMDVFHLDCLGGFSSMLCEIRAAPAACVLEQAGPSCSCWLPFLNFFLRPPLDSYSRATAPQTVVLLPPRLTLLQSHCSSGWKMDYLYTDSNYSQTSHRCENLIIAVWSRVSSGWYYWTKHSRIWNHSIRPWKWLHFSLWSLSHNWAGSKRFDLSNILDGIKISAQSASGWSRSFRTTSVCLYITAESVHDWLMDPVCSCMNLTSLTGIRTGERTVRWRCHSPVHRMALCLCPVFNFLEPTLRSVWSSSSDGRGVSGVFSTSSSVCFLTTAADKTSLNEINKWDKYVMKCDQKCLHWHRSWNS